MIERFSKANFGIPETVYSQLAYLPDENYRINVSKQLFEGLSFYLNSFGVEIDMAKSSYRTKSIDRIKEKIVRRKSNVAVRDIYAVRFITQEKDRPKLTKLIQDAYPLTPNVFLDGKPSVREYANSQVRDFFRQNHNPHTSPLYSALHVNIVFERYGSPYLDIAEVQIMNHEELDIYDSTRQDYIDAQNLG